MKKRSCFSLFPLAAAAVSFIAIFCAKQVACDTVDTEDNLSSSLLSSSETQRTPDTLKDLPNNKLNCTYNCSCRLGSTTELKCYPLVPCNGTNVLTKSFTCQYCFQAPEQYHICSTNGDCTPKAMEYYVATCTVPDDFLCLGSRTFQKQVECSVVSSHSWSTAFMLSLFLGGFAADRFYLGHVGWGMFKLITLGGFGMWVLVDFLLLGLKVLGPADGSGFAPYNYTAITQNHQ